MNWDRDEMKRIFDEGRQILRDPHYSKELSAKLIDWLKSPFAPISDIAGLCLMKFGKSAFDDLLAQVTRDGPWPNAVWVLANLEWNDEQFISLLRWWLHDSTGDLERQCAVSFAQIILALKEAGQPPLPSDVKACIDVFTKYSEESPSMRLHLRCFQSRLKE
jgi:hypothetical protein